MKKAKYQPDMPRRLYSYFIGYTGIGAPSLSKFARECGITLSDLLSFKEKHKEFRRACEECSEIRRDYLIDNALTRRFDPSLVKYLIENEDSGDATDDSLTVKVEVVE